MSKTTGCFFTGSALKVLSMELVPPNREKMTGLAMQAPSQRVLGQALSGHLRRPGFFPTREQRREKIAATETVSLVHLFCSPILHV